MFIPTRIICLANQIKLCHCPAWNAGLVPCRFKSKILKYSLQHSSHKSLQIFISLLYSTILLFSYPTPWCSLNPHTIHSLPLLSLPCLADWSHLNSWPLILNGLQCCPANILLFGLLTQVHIPYTSFSPPTSNTSFLILTLSWLPFPLFHWKSRITQKRLSQSSLHHMHPPHYICFPSLCFPSCY